MTKKRIRLDWLIYLVMTAALVGLLIWATMGEIARNPKREANMEMEPYGMVTLQLETDPYPARPTGTVALKFMLMDSRNRTIQPDSFSFEYGPPGSDQPTGFGTVQPMAESNGMLMGSAQFPSVGTWWIRVHLTNEGYKKDVKFNVDVRPAQ